MAEILYWLGDASATTAVVVVKSDTVGTVTIGCNGQVASVGVDPAIEYGITKLEVTGLVANTSYAFTLSGVQEISGTLKTMPTGGAWKFGWGSCININSTQMYGYQFVLDHDIRAFFSLGDLPYNDGPMPMVVQMRWSLGAAIGGGYVNWASGRIAYDEGYDYFYRTPGYRYLSNHTPMYQLPDDHQYGNDWDWTPENTFLFTGLTTQANVDIAGGYANASAWSWNKGNPINSDEEAGDWKPSACLDAVANHPAKYYRKTIAQVEFFHIDLIAHTDPAAKTDKYKTVCIDNATWNSALGYTYSDPAGAALAKTRLGPKQLNWLLTRLAASTATFKVIVCGKHTYMGNATSDNEGWAGWEQERDYILKFISQYMAGVLWVTGDVHTSSVVNRLSGHCAINSSPLGQAIWLNNTGVVAYLPGFTEGMIWRGNGASGSGYTTGLVKNTYGVCEVTDAYLHPMIYSESGLVLWQGYLRAGENHLRSDPTAMAGEWA